MKRVVESCAGDKAPHPDGFSLTFFQHCWNTVRMDVWDAFVEFQERGEVEKSLNVSFVVFIPKREGASSMKDYRLISLVGSI